MSSLNKIKGGEELITSKQRKYLKSLAHKIEPILQIGKSGVTENVLKQIEESLEARELVKVKVLNNSLLDANQVANEIAETLRAEFVQSIGNKFTIYRESTDKKTIELPRK